MQLSSVRLEAEATFAWLQRLAPGSQERTELLIAKVPERTAFALYPADWADIMPALRAHVRARGVRGLRDRTADLKVYLLALRTLRERDLPPELHAVYRADVAALNIRDDDTLAREMREQFKQAGLGYANGAFCASACWYIWWLMGHRALLPPAAQARLDEVVSWFGAHLLQVPLAA